MEDRPKDANPDNPHADTPNLIATPTGNETDPSFSDALLDLTDGFAEFNSLVAFMTSSFSAVMSSNESIRLEVIQGAKQCSMMLQSRSQELKEQLDQVRERYRVEHGGNGQRT